MANSFETIATFDESALDQLHELQAEGEPSFVGGLINDYLTQVAELNLKVQAFEKSGDRRGLEQMAHKLKSSSAVLGLAKVAAICFAIEDSARAGNATAVNVQALAVAAPEAITRLHAYLSKLK